MDITVLTVNTNVDAKMAIAIMRQEIALVDMVGLVYIVFGDFIEIGCIDTSC